MVIQLESQTEGLRVLIEFSENAKRSIQKIGVFRLWNVWHAAIAQEISKNVL